MPGNRLAPDRCLHRRLGGPRHASNSDSGTLVRTPCGPGHRSQGGADIVPAEPVYRGRRGGGEAQGTRSAPTTPTPRAAATTFSSCCRTSADERRRHGAARHRHGVALRVGHYACTEPAGPSTRSRRLTGTGGAWVYTAPVEGSTDVGCYAQAVWVRFSARGTKSADVANSVELTRRAS
jgi:hypothetical protein